MADALRRRRERGEPVFDLTCSNPTQVGFDLPLPLLHRALERSENRFYDPHPRGLPPIRETVLQAYGSRAARLAPWDLLLTSCTSEAYAFLLKLLANPGDVVLAPAPTYPLLRYLTRLENVRLHHYPLHYAGEWFCDFEALRKELDRPRVRAVVLVHPNNPTGSYTRAEEWLQLAKVTAERGVALICDSVFFDFRLGDVEPPDPLLVDAPGLLFVLDGCSKAYLAPQLKLGWIAVRGAGTLRRRALEQLEVIADSYLTLSTPAQWAFPTLAPLKQSLQAPVRDRLQRNLAALEEQTVGGRVSLLRPEGGWYAGLRPPMDGDDEMWCVRLLEDTGTLVHPGSYFDVPWAQFVVVSLLTPPEVFDVGIRNLLSGST